jgi:hypothetical protein
VGGIRTCDLRVMSYAPGVLPCPPSLKSAGRRSSDGWPVAPHRIDAGRFHRVLFPNGPVYQGARVRPTSPRCVRIQPSGASTPAPMAQGSRTASTRLPISGRKRRRRAVFAVCSRSCSDVTWGDLIPVVACTTPPARNSTYNGRWFSTAHAPPSNGSQEPLTGNCNEADATRRNGIDRWEHGLDLHRAWLWPRVCRLRVKHF